MLPGREGWAKTRVRYSAQFLAEESHLSSVDNGLRRSLTGSFLKAFLGNCIRWAH
jgi:hypothetical protein